MIRKAYFSFILLACAISLGSLTALAQFSPVSGTVEMEGTGKPVAGATVEAWRLDIKQAPQSSKTSKSGAFTFAGLPLGPDFSLVVSGPGISPIVYPGVHAGTEKIVIKVSPGDGRKLTEADIRSASTDTGPGEVSEEEKKQRAEIEAKNAEIMAKNEKLKNADEVARRSNEEGNAAYNAGNYDLAIEKYSQGIEAVPDYIGSTPILWSGKMMSLKAKGRNLYNDGAKMTDADQKKAKYAEANKYFDDVLAGFDAAMKVVNTAEAPKDPAEQKRRDALKLGLYSIAIDAHRLKAVTLIDSTKTDQALALVTEYQTLETDPAKKLAAQTTLGDIMRLSYNYNKAAAAYRSALEMKPDHYEAMAGLGLSLFAEGAAATPENKELEQEGLNYMQKYTEMSPVSPTDPPAVAELKKSVKEAVDYLKAQKMAPQKVAAPGRKKQ